MPIKPLEEECVHATHDAEEADAPGEDSVSGRSHPEYSFSATFVSSSESRYAIAFKPSGDLAATHEGDGSYTAAREKSSSLRPCQLCPDT